MSSLAAQGVIAKNRDYRLITIIRRPHAATDSTVISYWRRLNCSIIERLPRCYLRLEAVKVVAVRTAIAIIGVRSWCWCWCLRHWPCRYGSRE